MARQARARGESGVYEVLISGNNKLIFVEESDRRYFLQLLDALRKNHLFEVFGYNLMDEAIFMVVKEGLEDVSFLIRNLLSPYATFYNNKYSRSGKLFRDRFKSMPLETDSQVLEALRDVHRKKGLSSYPLILKKSEEINFEPVLMLMNGSVIDFRIFMEDDALPQFEFLTEEKKKSLSDYDLVREIKSRLKGVSSKDLENISREEELEIIKIIKTIPGASIRQISRVLGVPKSRVERA